MKLLLLRTWKQNIGNGFIYKGARSIIKCAFPDANIIEVSGFSNIAYQRHQLGELSGISKGFGKYGEYIRKSRLGSVLRKIRTGQSSQEKNFVNIGELTDADLAVPPGCVLTPQVLECYLGTFQKISQKEIPIVVLGAGGGSYDTDTQASIRSKLSALERFALLTRDQKAYSRYSDLAELSYDGIDCAFHIEGWHNPISLDKNYISFTFDKTNEPILETNREVIRPTHNPFGYSMPFDGVLSSAVQKWIRNEFFSRDNVFISDLERDYLLIYKNSIITHADRIHACVPSLVYNNRAQLRYDTPRALLFEKVDHLLDGDIRTAPVTMDTTELEKLKNKIYLISK